MGPNKMRQREHDGEATTSRSGTFLAEAIRAAILIVVTHSVSGGVRRVETFCAKAGMEEDSPLRLALVTVMARAA